jgi:hypothetical protein
MDYWYTHYIILVSISLSLAVFAGIIVYHVIAVMKHKCKLKLKLATTPRLLPVRPARHVVTEEDGTSDRGSPCHVINRRESMIYYMDI